MRIAIAVILLAPMLFAQEPKPDQPWQTAAITDFTTADDGFVKRATIRFDLGNLILDGRCHPDTAPGMLPLDWAVGETAQIQMRGTGSPIAFNAKNQKGATQQCTIVRAERKK